MYFPLQECTTFKRFYLYHDKGRVAASKYTCLQSKWFPCGLQTYKLHPPILSHPVSHVNSQLGEDLTAFVCQDHRVWCPVFLILRCYALSSMQTWISTYTETNENIHVCRDIHLISTYTRWPFSYIWYTISQSLFCDSLLNQLFPYDTLLTNINDSYDPRV